MIDLIDSLAANVRERLIRQIYKKKEKEENRRKYLCVNPLLHFRHGSTPIIRLINQNMLIIMLRLF